MNRIKFPNKLDLFNQRPSNITDMSEEELKRKYSKDKRRKYPPAIDILVFWENTFHLDWGEPICFACRAFCLDGAKEIYEYEEKNKNTKNSENWGIFNVWKSYLTQCHIIAASAGGPSEAWNIVYLCDTCHSCLDNSITGSPQDYFDTISWIKHRGDILAKTKANLITTYANAHKFKYSLENSCDIVALAVSDNAHDPQINHHLYKKRMSNIELTCACYYYAIDMMLKQKN